MTPPFEAVIMKHVGGPALAAVFAGVASGGTFLIGIVFLGYGAQSELSRWISDGAAALVVGAALFAGASIILLRKARPTLNPVGEEQVQSSPPVPRPAGSLLTSNLAEFARTAVIGISTRRPIAMLAIAALGGAALLLMSDGERDARTASGRRPL